MNPGDPEIVEQDGDVVRIVAGELEVLAEMVRGENEITFRRLSIDGGGPGTVGLRKLKELARRFAIQQNIGVIRVYGTVRTTGANPGKTPREIVIRV